MTLRGTLEIGDGYRAKNSELGGDGPIFMRAGRLTQNGWDWDGAERFHAELTAKVKPKMAKPGDTVITTKGNSTGRTGYVPKDSPDFVYSPHLSYWRSTNPDEIDSRYLRYWALSSEFHSQLKAMAHGTDMAPYLSLSDQKRIEITLPAIEQQRDISDILGALDDKIATNERIVTTTQLLIQARYLQAINKESNPKPLGDLVEFHNRKRVPLSSRQRAEIPGPYPYYGAAGVVDYIRDFIFSGPHLLVGEDGSVITAERKPVTQYVWGDFWVNNHAHVLTGREISTELLTVALQFTDVAALVTGAVQPKLNMRNLMRLEVPLPTEKQTATLDKEFCEATALIRRRSDESRTLADLRDTLLPQLMSGKLRVRDAEKIVEDAV
ncbi:MULTISPECIES: restriction endonuclease subunit S [Streptomyces]|uniref:Restriction endonuclease subunit S n=1 Tax=Streptomyces fimbriatus TaxID=68197 RepID=A0ABW0D5X0_STRFI